MTAKVRIREIVAWHLFKFYFYIGLSHPFMQSINRMRKYDFSKVAVINDVTHIGAEGDLPIW